MINVDSEINIKVSKVTSQDKIKTFLTKTRNLHKSNNNKFTKLNLKISIEYAEEEIDLNHMS